MAPKKRKPPKDYEEQQLTREPFCCECYDEEHWGRYQFIWHWVWKKPVTTYYGSTGWATILESSNDKHKVGEEVRIHYCAHFPCEGHWELSKYGSYGAVIHVVDDAVVKKALEAGSGDAAASSGDHATASSSGEVAPGAAPAPHGGAAAAVPGPAPVVGVAPVGAAAVGGGLGAVIEPAVAAAAGPPVAGAVAIAPAPSSPPPLSNIA